jgi:cation transporter-like permease
VAVEYTGAEPVVEERFSSGDFPTLGVTPLEASAIRAEERADSAFESLSICDGMLLGLLGGVLGGMIVAAATDAGGLDSAFDVEYCAIVGLVVGTVGALLLAVARRLQRTRSPQA